MSTRIPRAAREISCKASRSSCCAGASGPRRAVSVLASTRWADDDGPLQVFQRLLHPGHELPVDADQNLVGVLQGPVERPERLLHLGHDLPVHTVYDLAHVLQRLVECLERLLYVSANVIQRHLLELRQNIQDLLFEWRQAAGHRRELGRFLGPIDA